MAKPPSLKLLKLCGGSALYLRAADRTLLPQPLKQKRFARAGKGKSRHRWRRHRAIERFTMKQIFRSDSVCNGSIVYSLHRGRSRRALVRVVSDCCGLYRVAWLDIGLSDLANLTRCKAAAREWAEQNAVLADRKTNAARRLKSLDNFWWSWPYVEQNVRAVA